MVPAKTFLWCSILLLAAACLTPREAAARVPAPGEQNRLLSLIDRRPMVFFVAKGSADSCGRGCSEWIAAVGSFDIDTADRFREFVAKLNGRNLPIFFHSRGGYAKTAAEIGLILRERRMTAGIGRTETKRCRVFDKKDAACQSIVEAGQGVTATLSTNEAQCHSACVIAFSGASFRKVAPGAFLGVHQPRFPKAASSKQSRKDIKEYERSTFYMQRVQRRYFLEMGIDPAVSDIAAKVSHTRIYLLSRSEIERLGFETRDSFETPWITLETVKNNFWVMKSLTRRIGEDPAEYLTFRWLFSCTPTSEAPGLVYQRELAINSKHATSQIEISLAGTTVSFNRSTMSTGVEMGYAALDRLKEQSSLARASAEAFISMKERRTADSPSLVSGKFHPSVETKLSTAGLASGLEELRKRCGRKS